MSRYPKAFEARVSTFRINEHNNIGTAALAYSAASASAASVTRDMAIASDAAADATAAVKLFGEVQTNTYETGQQTAPAVARLVGENSGGYVIAWTAQGRQDGNGNGVFAQRYDPRVAAVGPEFRVNSQTLGTQSEVAVGGLANGGFVVAWRSDGQEGNGSYGVYGQRYAADGSKVGAEFRASTTPSDEYEPAVIGLADGSFVIAYRGVYAQEVGYYYDVLAQRFAADGTPLGDEVSLNPSSGDTQEQTRLAALAGGGFVAVWTDTGSCSVPCDHIPFRSWPLFRAREVMLALIESFAQERSQ